MLCLVFLLGFSLERSCQRTIIYHVNTGIAVCSFLFFTDADAFVNNVSHDHAFMIVSLF